MILCRVIGSVIPSQSPPPTDPVRSSGPLLIVQPLDQAGQRVGREIVAEARVRTSVGDLVLVDPDIRGRASPGHESKTSVQAVAIAVVEGLNDLHRS